MKATPILALAMAVGLTATTARAQSVSDVEDFGAESSPPKPLIPDAWYRPTLAIAYAAAPPIAYFGSEAADSYWPVVPAWLLAPSVHWASRRGWRAGISLVMQPAAAYTGWMVGIAVTRPSCAQEAQYDCGHEDAAMGILVGYLSWAVADLVLVSDVKPRPLNEGPVAQTQRRQRIRVTPIATVTPRGQLVGGVVGRF
jgi:hypothetical protein